MSEQQSPAKETERTELPIFVKWMEFLKWLMPLTDGLPKKVRFTFSDRINNLALDLVEELVEARYSRNRATLLRSANIRLEKLRVLMRLCHESQFISVKSYKYSVYSINEIGRMLGGWMKSQEVGT